MTTETATVCLCGGASFQTIFDYGAPPAGETRFALAGPYARRVVRCDGCGHFLSQHQMQTDFYRGTYMTATYGSEDGLRSTFERIIALDPAQSDNAGRVERLLRFAATRGVQTSTRGTPSILDVGSGLCVFLHRMKQAGWRCVALDPDARAARHAREVVGVETIQADFFEARPAESFDAVTFNKVLEHVADPVAMLARARRLVRPEGFVYVELPDGEAAAAAGPEREEFFIEHLHVFSAASIAILVARAGFVLQAFERLREPSGKYTLRAFATASPLQGVAT